MVGHRHRGARWRALHEETGQGQRAPLTDEPVAAWRLQDIGSERGPRLLTPFPHGIVVQPTAGQRHPQSGTCTSVSISRTSTSVSHVRLWIGTGRARPSPNNGLPNFVRPHSDRPLIMRLNRSLRGGPDLAGRPDTCRVRNATGFSGPVAFHFFQSPGSYSFPQSSSETALTESISWWLWASALLTPIASRNSRSRALTASMSPLTSP